MTSRENLHAFFTTQQSNKHTSCSDNNNDRNDDNDAVPPSLHPPISEDNAVSMRQHSKVKVSKLLPVRHCCVCKSRQHCQPLVVWHLTLLSLDPTDSILINIHGCGWLCLPQCGNSINATVGSQQPIERSHGLWSRSVSSSLAAQKQERVSSTF
jgi:hypothetical protein